MIRVVVYSLGTLSLSEAHLDSNVKTVVEENFKFVTEECVRVKVKSPMRRNLYLQFFEAQERIQIHSETNKIPI